jgi:hypothetical protein
MLRSAFRGLTHHDRSKGPFLLNAHPIEVAGPSSPLTHFPQSERMQLKGSRRVSTGMAVFYFHVRAGTTLFEDRQGGEFADVGAAWAWAVRDVEQLVESKTLEEPVEENWMEIHDAAGATLATLPFSRVLTRH